MGPPSADVNDDAGKRERGKGKRKDRNGLRACPFPVSRVPFPRSRIPCLITYMLDPKKLIVVGDRVLVEVQEGEERTGVGLYLPPTAIASQAVQKGRIV